MGDGGADDVTEPARDAVVRHGDERDVEHVLDLGRRVAMSSVSAFRAAAPLLVEASYERLVEYVLSRSHDLLIAEEYGAPVGFMLFIDDLPEEVTLDPQGFIAYMAVEPGARRRGIGTALLAAAEIVARERGLPTISLMVTEENRAARELYEAGGYFTERRLMTKVL